MSIQDAALTLLISQHNSHNAIQEELARLAEENRQLKAAQHAERQAKGTKAKKVATHSPKMPSLLREATVESAHEFLKSMRAAKSREESIKAIDLFIGYNLAGNFGDQDIRARMLAQSTIKPVSTTGPTKEELRSACQSAKGFVAGLPDYQAKQLANLRAQAERVTETLIECEKAGNEVGAAVERERLTHIYTQIKSMGFDH